MFENFINLIDRCDSLVGRETSNGFIQFRKQKRRDFSGKATRVFSTKTPDEIDSMMIHGFQDKSDPYGTMKDVNGSHYYDDGNEFPSKSDLVEYRSHVDNDYANSLEISAKIQKAEEKHKDLWARFHELAEQGERLRATISDTGNVLGAHAMGADLLGSSDFLPGVQLPDQLKGRISKEKYAKAKTIACELAAAGSCAKLIHPSKTSDLLFHIYTHSHNQYCKGALLSMNPELILFRSILKALLDQISAVHVCQMFEEFKAAVMRSATNDAFANSSNKSFITLFLQHLCRVLCDQILSVTKVLSSEMDFRQNYQLYIKWMLSTGYVPVRRVRKLSRPASHPCQCRLLAENLKKDQILSGAASYDWCTSTLFPEWVCKSVREFCTCRSLYKIEVMDPDECLIFKKSQTGGELTVVDLSRSRFDPANSSDAKPERIDTFVYVANKNVLSEPLDSYCGGACKFFVQRCKMEELENYAATQACRPQVVLSRKPAPRQDFTEEREQLTAEIEKREATIEDVKAMAAVKEEAADQLLEEFGKKITELQEKESKMEHSIETLRKATETEVKIGSGILQYVTPVILGLHKGDPPAMLDQITKMTERMDNTRALINALDNDILGRPGPEQRFKRRMSLKKQYLQTDEPGYSANLLGDPQNPALYSGTQANALYGATHLETTTGEAVLSGVDRTVIEDEAKRLHHLKKLNDMMSFGAPGSTAGLAKRAEMNVYKKGMKDLSKRIEAAGIITAMSGHTLDSLYRVLDSRNNLIFKKDDEIANLEDDRHNLTELVNAYYHLMGETVDQQQEMDSLLREQIGEGKSGVRKEKNDREPTIYERIKAKKEEIGFLRNQLQLLVKKAARICSALTNNDIYRETAVFETETSLPEWMPDLSVHEPRVIDLRGYLGKYDEVVATKLSVDAIQDTVPGKIKTENDYWNHVMVFHLGAKPTYTFANTLLMFVPGAETNHKIMTPFFQIMFSSTEKPSVPVRVDIIDDTHNPVSTSVKRIVELDLIQSMVGSIMNVYYETELRKEEQAFLADQILNKNATEETAKKRATEVKDTTPRLFEKIGWDDDNKKDQGLRAGGLSRDGIPVKDSAKSGNSGKFKGFSMTADFREKQLNPRELGILNEGNVDAATFY